MAGLTAVSQLANHFGIYVSLCRDKALEVVLHDCLLLSASSDQCQRLPDMARIDLWPAVIVPSEYNHRYSPEAGNWFARDLHDRQEQTA